MSEKVPHLHITIVRYDQRGLIESVTGIDEMGETRTLPRLQLHSRLKYEPGSVTCEGHVEGNHHLVIFQGGFIIRVIDADDRPIRDQLGHLPGSSDCATNPRPAWRRSRIE